MRLKPYFLIAILGVVLVTSIMTLIFTLVLIDNRATIKELEQVEKNAYISNCVTLRNLETKLLLVVEGGISTPRSTLGLTQEELQQQEAFIELLKSMRLELIQELRGRGCRRE